MQKKMQKMTEMLIDKTIERLEKETVPSKKTLRMISLSRKLFATIGICVIDN